MNRLNRKLKDIIIVDNNPESFRFHPLNGIPIVQWYGDQEDRKLEELLPALMHLKKVKDVRIFIENSIVREQFIPKVCVEIAENKEL